MPICKKYWDHPNVFEIIHRYQWYTEIEEIFTQSIISS